MEKLQLNIESLIFSAEKPIKIKDIRATLELVLQTKFKDDAIRDEIDHLINKYKSEQFSFEIVEISDGFQFMTKGSYYSLIAELLKLQSKKKLSKTALETLAIIAYKQPVTKTDIEHIRGVASDYSVQKLLEKDLIAISGRSDGPGRPLMYGTSEKFMDHFNLKSLNDLPKLKEFELEENSIGFQSTDKEPELIVYNAASEFKNEEE